MSDEQQTDESGALEEGALDGEQRQQATDGGKTTDNPELSAALAELSGTLKTLKGSQGKTEEAGKLSPEEEAEVWAIYNPKAKDPEFFRKFLRLKTDMEPAEIEAAVKEFEPVFADMQKGLVRQAVVGARNLFQIELGKIREEFTGVSQYVAERKAQETTEAFGKAYPALADPTYEKVVAATAKTLKQEDFKSQKDYFKALAEGAAEFIKALKPDFDLGAEAAPNGAEKKTAASTPRLPRSSAGGTGGTGGRQQTAVSGGSRNDVDSLDD